MLVAVENHSHSRSRASGTARHRACRQAGWLGVAKPLSADRNRGRNHV